MTNSLIAVGGAGGLGLAEFAHRAREAAAAVLVAAFGAADLAQRTWLKQQVWAHLLAGFADNATPKKHLAALTQ